MRSARRARASRIWSISLATTSARAVCRATGPLWAAAIVRNRGMAYIRVQGESRAALPVSYDPGKARESPGTAVPGLSRPDGQRRLVHALATPEYAESPATLEARMR